MASVDVSLYTRYWLGVDPASNKGVRKGVGSVANLTILLVDLQLFEILRQRIYRIRSFNCGLYAPQAHTNRPVAFGKQ